MNTQSPHTKPTQPPKTGLVPIGFTIGIGLLALALNLAGYGFRLLIEPFSVVALHALKVVPVFMIVVPSLTCAVAMLINRFNKDNIAMRNAWTFGWLLSAVFMLSKMGVYS